jgi:site-specific DNA-methyltransferase (adenine-specific)
MRTFPEGVIDLTVTSPPYDNLRTYKGYNFNFEEIAKELYRVTKDGGVVVWVVNDATIKGSETGTSFRQALYFKEIGFNLHDTMIYAKNNPMPQQLNRYQPCFEYMFIFSSGKPKTFNPILIEAIKYGKCKPKIYASGQRDSTGNIKKSFNTKHNNNPLKYKHNIWEYNVAYGQISKDKIAHNHPAIFPEQLAQDHILSWSNEGDLVLDPFMGSGTTAKMAVSTGRKYIGYELSKEYCDIAEKRIQEHTQQMAII